MNKNNKIYPSSCVNKMAATILNSTDIIEGGYIFQDKLLV